MVNKRRGLVYFLLLYFCAMGVSRAQQSESVKFRLLSMSNVATLLYDSEEGTKEIYASAGSFSSFFSADKGGVLKFYKEEPSPEEGKPPIKSSLAEVRLPNKEGPFLVILRELQQSSGLQYDCVVIDHSLEAHPPKSYRTFNYSKRRMAVRLANVDMLLDQGESGIVNYPSERKAWLKVAVNDPEAGWIRVISAPRAIDTTTRTTFLLVDVPGTEKEPDPTGIVVREIREQIYKDETGFHIR